MWFTRFLKIQNQNGPGTNNKQASFRRKSVALLYFCSGVFPPFFLFVFWESYSIHAWIRYQNENKYTIRRNPYTGVRTQAARLSNRMTTCRVCPPHRTRSTCIGQSPLRPACWSSAGRNLVHSLQCYARLALQCAGCTAKPAIRANYWSISRRAASV